MRQVNIRPEAILLESEGKNTAPAAILAALHCTRNESDSVMLILPADHLIENSEKFSKAISSAAKIASVAKLETFGIVPTGPETGYGNIRVAKTFRQISD